MTNQATMEPVEYKEIRTGQYVFVRQAVPQTPGSTRLGMMAFWAGKVTEVNAKWLKMKNDGKEFIVPQQGVEKFYTMPKKDFERFVKEFNIEYYDRDEDV